MKKIILIFLSIGFSLLATGCSMQTIDVNKNDDGTTSYGMYGKAEPLTKTWPEKNGYKVHSYQIDIRAKKETDEVEVILEHKIGFTQGSGTPSSESVAKNYSHGLSDFNIIGLKATGDTKVKKRKHGLFDWWYEFVKKSYSKKEFIAFFKTHAEVKMTIDASKEQIISLSKEREMPIFGMQNIKKFALCLENEAMCVDKK